MNPDEPSIDTADADRLMNLVGELHMSAAQAQAQGSDLADVLACFGQVIGELLADQIPQAPTAPFLVSIGAHANRAHTHRAQLNARLEAAREHLQGQLGLRRY